MMGDGIAIELTNVCKAFKIKSNHSAIQRSRDSKKDTIHTVLNDFSLKVHKGEVLGIIGHNGCGKSTLLSIISRIMEPDSGSVHVDGKLASILELGMGFHSDMTGRENIYIKAELYGFTKKQIDERMQSIIDYSNVGEYIDSPLRTYSSGMQGRLAFAIMVNVNADILLIDEVLSTGDIGFSIKAKQHFRTISKTGKTVILVSHSLPTIESMCTRTIWLDGGKIRMDGNPKKVCASYKTFESESEDALIEQAKAGVAESQYKLFQIYAYGKNADSKKKANYWLALAAESGYPEAQLEYANVIFDDDPEAATKYYESAAENGSLEAILKLVMLRNSSEFVADNDELVNVYQKLALTGNPRYEYLYARLLQSTATTLSEKQRAFEQFHISAEHGNPDSLYAISQLYMKGIGVKKNINAAVLCLEKASSVGHIKSVSELAKIYYDGKFVEQDLKKAFDLFSFLAECGVSSAQYRLATMYGGGEGIAPSEEMAQYWFTMYAKSILAPFQIRLYDARWEIGNESALLMLDKACSSHNASAIVKRLSLSRADSLADEDLELQIKELLHICDSNRILALRLCKRCELDIPDSTAAELLDPLVKSGNPAALYMHALDMAEFSKDGSEIFMKYAATAGNRSAINQLESVKRDNP